MSIRFAPLFVAFVVLAATVAGCGQTAGETCQLDGDCEGDLFCCTTGTVGTRGVCQAPGTSCLTAVDAGPGTDAGPPTDAGTDAGASDAGESDAGTDAGESDAGTDAGESDAGETDAGESDAGETDAGTSGT